MDLAAVVLAAGAGRRLRPLTLLRPKPLCPVGNVALVDHALARVAGVVSAQSVAVNVHHFRDQMETHLAGRAHVSVEEGAEALGTAGALGLLRGWIGGRGCVVVNGDTWHPEGLDSLVTGWDGERPRLLVADTELHGGQGDFGRWRYVGACVLPWADVAGFAPVPTGLYEVSWGRRFAEDALEFVPSTAPAIDCATPADYLAANLAASGGESVIGPGAVVEGTVVRSVVWPGCRVEAGERLVDAIRADDGLTVSGRSAAPD